MGRRKLTLYCVWRNLPANDEIVAVDMTASQCAAIIGCTLRYFYKISGGEPRYCKRWLVRKSEPEQLSTENGT